MKKNTPILPLIFAFIFPILLHKQEAGLNVLLLNTALLGLLLWSGRLAFKNTLIILPASGMILSSVMSLINGSSIAVTVNVISMILLCGLLAAPQLSVLGNGFLVTLISLFTAPFNYLKSIGSSLGSGERSRRAFRYLSYIIVPFIALLIFISLYSASSPYYKAFTGDILLFVEDFFTWLFKEVSPGAFAIGVSGLITGVMLLYGKMTGIFDLPGEVGVMNLQRVKRWYKGSPIGLRAEMKTGILLFVFLNIALAAMNILDFWHVWVNFKWDGGFLKQFVHEGTWLLILSIIISMALVLWYFRGNLNFYRKNRFLLILTRIWLAQNIFLALSVAVRNFWYLHYFNLAYKRIWVYAFLILVIIGLITIIIKVEKKKTLKYLLVRNSIFAYVTLVVLCLFNWDVIIAKYNVSRATKAFYHTDFMCTLNNSALPVLILNQERLDQIEKAQSDIFTYHKNYLDYKEYNEILLSRKIQFVNEYPEKHWLSWNLAEWNAYRKLK